MLHTVETFCAGLLFLGPGFNCLWTGYWYHYNLLPPEVRERVDRYKQYFFFDEHKYKTTLLQNGKSCNRT
jgi:hypothetical protein